MKKNFHEIRDPIHTFIRMDSDERRVVDSRPFQRLRYIHQLATSYLLYPGANHTRFEHSLGVMELASRVFNIITAPFVNEQARDMLPELGEQKSIDYWHRVLRVAALCHDLGHLPFSHAAERELLPDGWDHERLTAEIIRCNEMKEIWDSMTPPLRADDIVKVAIGPRKAHSEIFTNWEAILAEIIVGDAFGVDRMDYLLRDSYHAGVLYGKFDHYRLIDTLRILPYSLPDKEDSSEDDQKGVTLGELMLGVEEGGLHSAEALLLARYFMFSQVYCHPIRRMYDIHLKDFLKAWLPNGYFKVDVEELLDITDIEVTAGLRKAARNSEHPACHYAQHLIERRHFKVLYEHNPEDIEANPDAVDAVYDAACGEFGDDNIKMDKYAQEGPGPDFPVLNRNQQVVSSLALSQTLPSLPLVGIGFVFAAPDILGNALKWLKSRKADIIGLKEETL